MQNLFIKIFIFLLFIITLAACQKETSANDIKIGIVIPIEHTALQEIISGFKDTLPTLYGKPVKIIEKNAQGDPNIQRAIIQQMRDENYTLIVPLGTGASEMTSALIRQQPILSVAADITEKERNQLKPCNMAIVHDNISAKKIFSLIHQAYPQIKNIALIHSSEDKALKSVKETIEIGKNNQITVTSFMAATLPELNNIANALPANTDAIFILKDNTIASGIATLVKMAEKKHIPLITSDQGTVSNGASFALSVPERQIGAEAAKLAAQILNGENSCALPIVEMEDKTLTIFIHQTPTTDDAPLIKTANELGYALDIRKS